MSAVSGGLVLEGDGKHYFPAHYNNHHQDELSPRAVLQVQGEEGTDEEGSAATRTTTTLLLGPWDEQGDGLGQEGVQLQEEFSDHELWRRLPIPISDRLQSGFADRVFGQAT